MNKSENIAKISAAIVKAQPKIQNAHKDSKNPFFNSKYASLLSVWDACKEALSETGIAVLQPTRIESGAGEWIREETINSQNEQGSPVTNYSKRSGSSVVIVETMLLHESGEWISGENLVIPDKETPQGFGSAITYARRYGLSAMVGICPEDDDGEGATNRGGYPKKKPPQSKPTTPPPNKPTTPPENSAIVRLYDDIDPNMDNKAKLDMAIGILEREITSVGMLSIEDKRKLIDGLKAVAGTGMQQAYIPGEDAKAIEKEWAEGINEIRARVRKRWVGLPSDKKGAVIAVIYPDENRQRLIIDNEPEANIRAIDKHLKEKGFYQ